MFFSLLIIHWFATQVTSKVEGTMGYEDFVYFILAEEDKSSVPSLEYWFKYVDLDGNGILTRHDAECMEEEAVLFEDVLCKISDMIGPEVETLCLMILWLLYAQAILVFKESVSLKSYITMPDLKGSKLSGDIYNMLFNLNKFMAFETHDPLLVREKPTLTEWDRFAHREYIRLSMNGSGEVRDELLEAPL
ncbi:hypothetical protein HID58_049455 [Brassica napus]|uniref:EF-hand domain-containing protein n=1 Tax=Brassica napus TaxID=3708 RepID=A0ABQ8B5V2_BRANA|nr:hypothetical protein HID58_049455 [Brassica napus]